MSVFLSGPAIKYSIYMYLLLAVALLFEFLFVKDLSSIICLLIFLMCLPGSIALLTLRMSSIPNNVKLPCGTTRNLHNFYSYFMSYCYTTCLHSCISFYILYLLYVLYVLYRVALDCHHSPYLFYIQVLLSFVFYWFLILL